MTLNAKFEAKLAFFVYQYELEIGWVTLKKNYAPLSLVHNFIAICEFILELSPGNAETRVELAFSRTWPSN